MKFVLSLFIMLSSLSAFAIKEPSSLQIYPLGTDLRFERASDQNLEAHSYLNFAAAYQFTNVSFLLEFSQFSESSGNPTTSIDHTHQDLALWGRWHFAKNERASSTASQFSLYVGLGVGGYQDEVTTGLMGSSRTDKSGVRFLSAVSAGGDMSIYFSRDFALTFAVEGRTLFASDFDPNPTFAALGRIGFLLPLH